MRLRTGCDAVEEVQDVLSGCVGHRREAVRASDGRGSDGWDESALEIWLNRLYIQQATLNLGQPAWEYEHFEARYQFKMLRTTGVIPSEAFHHLTTPRMLRIISLVLVGRNSRRVVAQDLYVLGGGLVQVYA